MKMARNSQRTRQDGIGSGTTASKSRWIRKRLTQGILFSLVACCCGLVKGELPPGSYESLKSKAEEVLAIRITKVTAHGEPNSGQTNYTIDARVLSVKQSKSGIGRGETIRFHSYAYEKGVIKPGPVSPPKLNVNWTGRIYLNYPRFRRSSADASDDRTIFELAAYGKSFERRRLGGRLFGR